MKIKRSRFSSRRRTPWDDSETDEVQKLIQKRFKEDYRTKHLKLSETEENKVFNSMPITICRRCGKGNIKKNGFDKKGLQRYYCKDCKRDFVPTTNTIFENHKISLTEWIDFLYDLFNYGSTSLVSKINKNSISTTNYWLDKVFLVLQNYQNNIKLSGKVYIDEMFYSVIKSDIKMKNGNKLRGISNNQYCIGIGYDGTNVIAIVEGLGKTSIEKTKNAFQKHIAPGSLLIHDDEKAHRSLVKDLNLVNKSYNSLLLKGLDDKQNPLRPVNHQCDLAKQFLNTHSGFNRSHLQDYLNLFCFISNGHKDRLEKIYDFIKLALNTNIQLKYRDCFKMVDDVDDIK